MSAFRRAISATSLVPLCVVACTDASSPSPNAVDDAAGVYRLALYGNRAVPYEVASSEFQIDSVIDGHITLRNDSSWDAAIRLRHTKFRSGTSDETLHDAGRRYQLDGRRIYFTAVFSTCESAAGDGTITCTSMPGAGPWVHVFRREKPD